MNNVNFICSLDDTSCIIKEESIYDSLFKQYERVVLESLITSFGLDMLMGDKHGGDVDTIHNVRQIGKDEQMRYKNIKNEYDYNNKEEYNSNTYHKHSNYINTNREYSKQRKEGTLKDGYTGEILDPTISHDLDHIISAKEIHEDKGRILSGLKGEDLANDPDTNLTPTNRHTNRSKGQKSMNEYLERNGDEYNEEQKERMKEKDRVARKAYETKIAREYYTSKKFFGDTAVAAGMLSFKMGIKAALGLVFAELWFAARDEIAKIASYGAELFNAIGRGIKKGFENAKAKYKEIWHKFLDGAVAGVLSSLVTTLTNIFFTTAKNVVRIIRQSWSTLVEATKILMFNPDCLRFGERIRVASKVLGTGACVLAGIMVTEAVSKTPLGTIPFAGEIAAAFCGTFVCGIMSCSLLYLLDRNETINKIVRQLDKLPTIENYIAYAKEQARMLEEHAAKVYNLDVVKFRTESCLIVKALESISDEMNDLELTIALKKSYASLNLLLPWCEGMSFNDFMQDRNKILIFK
ncbi:hypothetical protein [uncultured Muribaculum sp.]|uniref:hypothetical protein n=1 Tax=uncultured Muribaculum sp. TaxID=1918613 RepID=UPI0025B1DC9C|nr:hypothetical protein [uncultured Muribaculum sp.]